MAIMSSSNTEQVPPDSTDSPNSMYLDEADDDYFALTDWVQSKFNKSDTWREQDERRWLKAYRNYRGLYGPDVKFTEKEKSQAFIKVTKTKVLAAYAQLTCCNLRKPSRDI